MSATEDFGHLRSEIIECGRLPKRRDGSVDLYAVDRFLLQLEDTRDRVAVLCRLAEHCRAGTWRRPREG